MKINLNKIKINTDRRKLSLKVIKDYLNNQSYWAQNRSIEVIKKSIKNSLCFGVYYQNQQIGFTRVITDYATFYYICDFFILQQFQGNGIGKKLIKSIVNHSELKNIIGTLLTIDAHEFYRPFGFDNNKNIKQRFMLKHK